MEMESQMERNPHNVGIGSHGIDEHEQGERHEKKSVLKKVKDKAKKIKDTITHGHGHHDHVHVPNDHDLDEEDDYDDDDEGMVVDPVMQPPSAYESPAVLSASIPIQIGSQGHALTRNTQAMHQDTPGGGTPIDATERPPHVFISRTLNIKEVPNVPANTPSSADVGLGVPRRKNDDAVRSFQMQQETIHGEYGINLKDLEEDPHAPRDGAYDRKRSPSNYQSKVTDPTGAGGEEASMSSILPSLDTMTLQEGPNLAPMEQRMASMFPTGTHDQFSPEPMRPKPLSTNQSSSGKLSSATSAIANTAASVKNTVASKLGYSEQVSPGKDKPGNSGQGNSDRCETMESKTEGGGDKIASSTSLWQRVEYGKKIAATVSEKLTPMYEKVKGSSTDTRCTSSASENAGEDKGVLVKDYFVEKLKPREEDRALLELISETLYKRKAQDKPAAKAKVTESEEEVEDYSDSGSSYIPRKSLVDKVKGAVGSLHNRGEKIPDSQQTLGTQDVATASGEERRLQESGN